MKRILFVDDEKNVLDGVRRMLHSSRNEWEMEFVTSGQAALQACNSRAFDVVVSDLRMPGMDGADLLGQIRDLYPATARIILSGYSEIALAARAVHVAYRVLAKPCDPVDLKATIGRVCTLQDVLNKPVLQTIIGTLGELPSLSSTYIALNNALRDDNVSLSGIASIIEQDIAMSAKILQIVNSAFFGLSQRVSCLEHAVSYLGMDTIRTLALYSEAFRAFVPDKRIPASLWEATQRHSQRTVTIAGTFPLTRKMAEVTRMASLLHDIGTLVLATVVPDQFCSVLANMNAECVSQSDSEATLIGATHAEIGAYLLGLWGIDNIIVEAIAHHHHPARIISTSFDCSVAVYLADLLAHEIDAHPDDAEGLELSESDRSELSRLGYFDKFPEYRRKAVEALGLTIH